MKLVIPGNPIHKERARFFVRGGHIGSYSKQSKDEDLVKLQMKSQIGQEGIKFDQGKALNVEMSFYLPKPNSISWFEFEPLKKPDLDNLVKFYCDAANGIVWNDDKQITSLQAKKVYSSNPRTEIKIMTKKEFTLHSKAKGILEILGPEKMEELSEDLFTLDVLGSLNLTDPICNSEEDCEDVACFLSYFSHKWVKDFLKIDKKYGDYHKERGNKITRLKPHKQIKDVEWEIFANV